MSRIFAIIMIVCVVILGAFWYANRSKTRAVNSGAVFVHDQPDDKAKTEGDTAQAAPADQGPQPEQSGAATEAAQGSGAAAAQAGGVAPPVSDSITREPPNGTAFAGKGRYQVYRQGDITWRLNTETGKACVLFATDAEWRQPRVFQQGCAGQ